MHFVLWEVNGFSQSRTVTIERPDTARHLLMNADLLIVCVCVCVCMCVCVRVRVCVLTRMQVDVSGFGRLGGHTLAVLLLPVGSLSYQVPANFLTFLWFDLPEWNARAGCAAQPPARRWKKDEWKCVSVCVHGEEKETRAQTNHGLNPHTHSCGTFIGHMVFPQDVFFCR